MKRINRSKYNFSKLEMGENFMVDALDLYSMKNSLRFFNNKHKQNIHIEVEDLGEGVLKATRVPAKVKTKN